MDRNHFQTVFGPGNAAESPSNSTDPTTPWPTPVAFDLNLNAVPYKQRHTRHRIDPARGVVDNLVRRAQPTAFDAGLI